MADDHARTYDLQLPLAPDGVEAQLRRVEHHVCMPIHLPPLQMALSLVWEPKSASAPKSFMCRWAKERGATHYTHWFQPLNDATAEKHERLFDFGENGEVLERFSGKLLIQQEPDASSFPSGGIRNTFEARGYTAWDVSSPAFIVGETLFIPTIFIAYTGEALDYKTPLLRALSSVDKAAVRVCQYFDKDVTKVTANLGWEQEYFLIDKALFDARPDLCLTGRTLMGHASAKDQQLEDHYFAAIPPRVMAFMAPGRSSASYTKMASSKLRP